MSLTRRVAMIQRIQSYTRTLQGLSLGQAARILGSLPGLKFCDYDPETKRGDLAVVDEELVVRCKFRQVKSGVRLHAEVPEQYDALRFDREVSAALKGHGLAAVS
ncbi:MAG: hypothetical protein A2855_00745 [Candidatus Liptonbacteria bacterium RIFCSPHIGHO2_01_FULL_57_28]|uniref:Uncharacterized protein n=1 Tax=Candidatus Liptonbacteria bacterium RIFCSPHIGHO2_01_FULL_57_28 TaxID=1798647 RepID=A0A1G2CC48_9BACT|nr:MAG: hypothetical protein A2855_00745 [Candidatus Liptonbacteria bacterium RIFCSPHIGHO2_01_FULL_57_28]